MTTTAPTRATVPLVRASVKDVLLRSPAYRALGEDQRRALAHDLVNVGQYIVDAGGETYGAPLAAMIADDAEAVRRATDGAPAAALADGDRPPDTAGADFAGQGGAVAGVAGTEAFTRLVADVNFPEFVAGLIDGVFNAIVTSSIQQMEAFAELVANVSKSVDQYMKDNVSENQARDYLADRYPEHLQVDISGDQPRIAPRDDADQDALPDFFSDLGLDFPVDDLDEETTEQILMPAARKQMAIDRQRMLLMMVLMGINRLVVTDGSIKAAVIFQLKTTDAVSQSSDLAVEYERQTKRRSKSGWFSGIFSPKWKETTTTNLNVTTSRSEDSEAQVDMKAKLSGDVNIRFKSETFPLDQMTTLLGVQEPQLPPAQPRPPAE